MDQTQTPTQQTAQPPIQILDFQPKPNYSKTIIISILGVTLLAATIYLYFQNQKLQKQVLNPPVSQIVQIPSTTPKTTSSISISPDETAGWKTYTNSVHGITFKYPPTWQIDNKGDQDQYNAQINLTNDQTKIKMYFNMDGIGGQGRTYQGKPIILDGNNLYIYNEISDYDQTQVVGISTSLINTLGVFKIEGKTYSITLKYPINYAEGETSKKEFDQILSTFKFVGGGELLNIKSNGGLCPSGNVCSSTKIIMRDGSVLVDNKLKTKADLTKLTSLINTTNFDEIRSRKFTGTCPTAYDGQEVIYTFYILTVTQTVSNCEFEIDNESPLFSEINKILSNLPSEK